MIKTILVPVMGMDGDRAALETGAAVARLFDGHIECLHIRPDPVQMAVSASSAVMGPGIVTAELWNALEEEDKARTKTAREIFDAFCKRHEIALAEMPPGLHRVSAAWREVTGDDVEQLIAHARFNDLVVIERAPGSMSLSPGGLGAVLIGSGRPILLAPAKLPKSLARTAIIAWKKTAEAARAITAAMPLLAKADNIVVLAVNENDKKATECMDCIERAANQLRWHGFKAEARWILPEGRTAPGALMATAREMDASFVVMGAYGHSRVRELVFGGFTDFVLGGTQIPVFMFH